MPECDQFPGLWFVKRGKRPPEREMRKGFFASPNDIFPDGQVVVSLRDDFNKKWTSAFGGSPFPIHIFAENTSQAQPTSHAARRISQICKANLFHCGLGIFLCPTHEAGGLRDAYQSLFRIKRWMMVAIWARLARPLGARVVSLMPEMMPSATAHCMASMA